MTRITTLVAVAAIPVVAAGWYLFRPELLFVDHQVHETVAAEAKTIRTGSFASYAHETTGTAKLVQLGDKTTVRLTDFKTSNGPDVHLYLVKGDDAQATEKGFLDLGSLKGNVGDQNYPVPAGTDLSQYGSVAVWCKRFNVGFGGAPLPAPKVAFLDGSRFQLAGYLAEEIIVTHGRLGKGEAAIVETGGKRFLRVTNATPGTHILLVKAETIEGDATVKASPKIDLGVVKSKLQQFPLSKEIDAWLYRSVSVWNGTRSLATAALRSDLEHKTASI